MKLRLLAMIGGCVLCTTGTPAFAKTTHKSAKTQPKVTLQWPRVSRQHTNDFWWENIGVLQQLLNARGAKIKIDSTFGTQTEAAVKQFQKAHKLKVDGIVGSQTWEKLVVRLKRGDKGPIVKALQSAMTGHEGQYANELGKETGVFGFETEKAVRDYQKSGGLKVDGIAGPQTWCILLGGKVKK